MNHNIPRDARREGKRKMWVSMAFLISAAAMNTVDSAAVMNIVDMFSGWELVQQATFPLAAVAYVVGTSASHDFGIASGYWTGVLAGQQENDEGGRGST